MQINFKNIIGILLIVLIYVSYLIPPINAADRIGNQWLYLSIAVIISTVCLFVYSTFDKVLTLKKDFILKSFLGFIIFTFLSIFIAENKVEGLNVFIQYLTLFLIYIILKLISYENPKYTKIVILSFLFFFIVDLIAVISPMISDIQNQNLRPRSINYIGLLSNVNITSFVLLYKLPFIIFAINRVNSNFSKGVFYFLFLITLNALFILGSRASLITVSFLFSGILFLAYTIKEKRKSFLKIFSLSLAMLLISILINMRLINNEYNVIDRASTISVSTKDGSVNERLNFYKHSLNMFIDSPILGIGTGNWKIESINYHKENIQQYIVPFFAHNDFLQVLSESGIFSFLFYIMLFIIPIISFFKNRTIFNGVLLIFIGIFFIDSILNFPLGRVANVLHFIFVLTLFDTSKNE